MKSLDHLTINEVVSLYHEKRFAENQRDAEKLFLLRIKYPDLFSEEFDYFLANYKIFITDVDQQLDENRSDTLTDATRH